MKKFNSVFFILCMLAFLAQLASAQPTPVVHYQFNETDGTVVSDATGNGNDGSIDCDTCWTEGYVGGAIMLDGVYRVTLPGENIGLDSDLGSVAFWMWAGEVTGDIYTMFWAGDNTTGGGFGDPDNEMHIHLEEAGDAWAGGELSFVFGGATKQHTFLFSDKDKPGGLGAAPSADVITLDDEQWHHVACTWNNGGNAAMYIDGAEVWVDYVYDNPDGTFIMDHMYIGTMGNASRGFVGKIDDFWLFDDVLLLEDIQDLYNLTSIQDYKVQTGFILDANYPNPFKQTTTISYYLPKDCDVLLTVYNTIGQEIRTLVRERQGYGTQQITWDGCNDTGEDLSSGIYVYRLQVDDKVQTRRMMLIR